MAKRPTIRDVAKAAGVSIATVSFVLNDRPGQAISTRVKQRVLRAAEKLNYHPSARAASLARKRTHNLAILFYKDHDLFGNQFYSRVLQGAIKEATRQQFNLLFAFVPEYSRKNGGLPKVIREDNAEGALFLRQIHPKLIADIQARSIPVVAVDQFPRGRNVNSLQIDNHHGGELAARHLAALGHKKIGILQGALDRPSVAERSRGFQAALVKHKIACPSSRILNCKALTFEAAYERARQLFGRGRNLSALFCVNDEMAAGALRAAHEAGLRVPQDVSIMGFDDVTLASYTDPPLSTIGVDKEGLGVRAVARLLELVEGKDRSVKRETMPVELVLRGSTAAPASG